MDIDVRMAALAFGGIFWGAFALVFAVLAGDATVAPLALAMTAYCAAEFVRTLGGAHARS